MPAVNEMRAGLESWRSFVLARCSVLQRYPRLLFQEAINEPEATAPARAAARAFATGEEKRPFIRWLNKPQATVRCLTTLTGHENTVDVCAFSPDGLGLVSGSWETVRFWDLRTARELATYPGHIVAVAPSGNTVLLQSPDHTIRLLDVATHREIVTVRGAHDNVSAAAFSRDGQRAVLGFEDVSLATWDPASGLRWLTLPGRERGVLVCALSLDGSRVLSRTWEGPWKFWDAETGNLLGEWPCGELLEAWGFSPDGTFFVCGSGGDALAVCDVRSGRELATLGHDRYDGVMACAISPDSSRIATGNMYGELKVWDAHTAREIATLLPERETRRTGQDISFSASACAFSPDGTRIVSLCSNGYLVLWDAASGSQVATLNRPCEGIDLRLFLGFSPDGGAVLCPRSSRAEVLEFWDVSTGRALGSLAGHRDQVRCCVFSPDRARIVTGSDDGTLRVWDAATAAGLGRQAGHSGKVTNSAFSPDGSRVVSGAEDGTLKLWDAELGRELVTMDAKAYIYVGGGDKIEYLKDDSGRIRASYSSDERREVVAGIKTCVFSPDGSRIVSESATGLRLVWDASTGRTVETGFDGGGEFEVGAPDRASRSGCPWQEGLTLERSVRRRRLRGMTDAEAIAAREVWVAQAGAEIARFPDAVGEVTHCDVSPIDNRFAVGDDLGFVYILAIENTPGASPRERFS